MIDWDSSNAELNAIWDRGVQDNSFLQQWNKYFESNFIAPQFLDDFGKSHPKQ